MDGRWGDGGPRDRGERHGRRRGGGNDRFDDRERSLRSIFVGNVPYDATDEDLITLFSEAGHVVNLRMVNDRESGKPKGFGFCEFESPDIALSAIRLLNGREIHGRQLRLDSAASERDRDREEHTFTRNQPPPGTSVASAPQPVQQPPFVPQAPPMHGDAVSPEDAPGAITKAVASLPPEQMFELMKQMKVCIKNSPDQARQMLIQNPQLAYALLQAQVVMHLVDPQVAQSILVDDMAQVHTGRGDPMSPKRASPSSAAGNFPSGTGGGRVAKQDPMAMDHGPPPAQLPPSHGLPSSGVGPSSDHRAAESRSGPPPSGNTRDFRGPTPMDTRGPPMDSRGPPMDSRGPSMDNRGPHPMDSRGPHPMDNRGTQKDNRGPPMGGPPPMDNRGPPPMDNRGPPPMDNRGPPPMDSRGPPMDDRGPPMDNRGPPMDSRGPPMDNRGPPMDSRGPPMDNRGPPMDSRGPPMDNRRPSSEMHGPRMEMRGPGSDSHGPRDRDSRSSVPMDNRPNTGPGVPHDKRGPPAMDMRVPPPMDSRPPSYGTTHPPMESRGPAYDNRQQQQQRPPPMDNPSSMAPRSQSRDGRAGPAAVAESADRAAAMPRPGQYPSGPEYRGPSRGPQRLQDGPPLPVSTVSNPVSSSSSANTGPPPGMDRGGDHRAPRAGPGAPGAGPGAPGAGGGGDPRNQDPRSNMRPGAPPDYRKGDGHAQQAPPQLGPRGESRGPPPSSSAPGSVRGPPGLQGPPPVTSSAPPAAAPGGQEGPRGPRRGGDNSRPPVALSGASAAVASGLTAGVGDDQEKAQLIMQVLNLTDEQIALLSADQRQSIMLLREQLSTAK
eukprot:scpid37434/ scgid0158/ Cleavage stimulation factor subunit 2; CF-1 64 kDa subunit; Cleavage stimulation factor 64 kDa subunit